MLENQNHIANFYEFLSSIIEWKRNS